MFCRKQLVGKERAREHVLKRSWQNALGHQKTVIAADYDIAGKVYSARQPVADEFVTGEVCSGCNNGWMRHLDDQVEQLVLGLAKGTLDPERMPRHGRRQLSRWLLKTACTLDYTSRKDARHMPRRGLDQVRNSQYLPSGFIAFACRPGPLGWPMRRLQATAIDVWLHDNPELTSYINVLTRKFKCAIQYDQIILGCAWIEGSKRPTFRGMNGIHLPLHLSRASYEPYTSAEIEDIRGMRDPVGRDFSDNLVSWLLFTLSVDFYSNG